MKATEFCHKKVIGYQVKCEKQCDSCKISIVIKPEKPPQYQIGIDTFERMESNCTRDEILAFCKGNIDKYNWRNKGSDLEDFKKIIAYANFAIKQLNNKL